MFHVCKYTKAPGPIWILSGALMVPQARIGDTGVLYTDLAPTELAIWLEEYNGIVYKWRIYVDTNIPGTPQAQYYFTDQTNDMYLLSANTVLLHNLDYNSAQPFITTIQIEPLWGPPGDWANAPICPFSTEIVSPE